MDMTNTVAGHARGRAVQAEIEALIERAWTGSARKPTCAIPRFSGSMRSRAVFGAVLFVSPGCQSVPRARTWPRGEMVWVEPPAPSQTGRIAMFGFLCFQGSISLAYLAAKLIQLAF